ncbi:MAG: cation:proton antiporter [Candidatus Woesearchaeota archaeon]
MDVNTLLLGVALLVFFGYLAEIIFKRFNVPDVLLLIIFGFAVGPYGFGMIEPADIAVMAEPFIAFVLLFLLFDGAFGIDLASFARGISRGVTVSIFNFLTSSIVVTLILWIAGYDIAVALFGGFALGGMSSAFVIPIIKMMQKPLKKLDSEAESPSVLTLESAFTDILCIVFALATLNLIEMNIFNVQAAFSNILSLFAVAGLIGILAGGLYIFLSVHFFEGKKFYMITIAYVILVYVIAEYFGGNGAIAALFLGLVLRNSKEITTIVSAIKTSGKDATGFRVTTREEIYFYEQIAFLLKTFFFVYIGILLNIENGYTLIIGLIIALALSFVRMLSFVPMLGASENDRKMVAAVFGRGLAPAAIAQMGIASQEYLPQAPEIALIIYVVITATIVLSSARVFNLKRSISRQVNDYESGQEVREPKREIPLKDS